MQIFRFNKIFSGFILLFLSILFLADIQVEAQQKQVKKIKHQSVINGKFSEEPGVTVVQLDSALVLHSECNENVGAELQEIFQNRYFKGGVNFP